MFNREGRTPTHGYEATPPVLVQLDSHALLPEGRPYLLPTRTRNQTGMPPKPYSCAFVDGQQVVKSLRYLLTDPRQFDILQSPCLTGTECNSIS
jgi:hypothetical protein